MDQTFVLYRILGNDLPPRHGTRQTIENLRFILDHEPAFPGCEKRWIVNRIADGEREADIINLLTERGQRFLRIPFDLNEYARLFLDAEGLPARYNALEVAAGKLPRDGNVLAHDWLFRYKNLYAMNLNVARNLAIDDGLKTNASWIMPWDGGCFLTAPAFTEIRSAAAASPAARYLLVPLARFDDNRALLSGDLVPSETEEPQVIFRRNARDRFDPFLRYANMNKGEFLVRIGAPGPWHEWQMTEWETRRFPRARDAGQFVTVGWVARLNPGPVRPLDAGSNELRLARFSAVAVHCAGLDARLIRAATERNALNCYAPFLGNVASTGATAEALLTAASSFLSLPPAGVTEKAKYPAGVERNDYVSMARYAREQADDVAVVPDRVENLAAIEAGPAALSDDRHRLQQMIDGVTALALAAEVVGEHAYADHAVRFVRAWFVDDTSRMNPHARFAQFLPQQPAAITERGVVDFRDLWGLCDALRLLERRGALSGGDLVALRSWFQSFLEDVARRGGALTSTNNIGVYHDLLFAAVAAYCGEVTALSRVLSRASLRIHGLVRPWGWQPAETSRAAPLHYSLFCLQGLIGLAWIGRNCGIDVWKYAGNQHRSIPMAARFIALNRTMFPDYAGAATLFDDRIEAALRAIPADAADVEVIADLPRRPLVDRSALGAPHGLAPWWQLLL